jgi:NADH-quinone oxidoreductase subunit L
MIIDLVWLVPLIPLIGFILNGLGRNTFSKGLTGFIGSGVIFISFAISVGIFLALGSDPVKSHEIFLFDWISAGSLHIRFLSW